MDLMCVGWDLAFIVLPHAKYCGAGEIEQDPMVLAPHVPNLPFAYGKTLTEE